MYTPNKIQEFLRYYILEFEIKGFGIEIWMILSFALLIVSTYLLWLFTSKTEKGNMRGSLLLISSLVLWLFYQIPNLAKYSVHINECQHIAEGNRIVNYPIFWSQLDGTTLGPFPIYFLGLFKMVGFPLDYFTVKILNFFIWSLIIIVVYKIFRQRYKVSDSLIFLSPLITIVFFFSDREYLGYNGEPFTVLLITVALFFVYRLFSTNFQVSRLSEFALGIVLVAIPFSKFQGGPIAFVIGLYYVTYLLINKKSLVPILTGVLAFLLGISFFLVLTDSYYDFWQSYIINNISYTATSEGLNSQKGLIVRVLKLVLLSFGAPETRILYLLAFLFFLFQLKGSYSKIRIIKRDKINFKSEQFFLLILLIISVLTVYAPGNVFNHYALFLLVPSLLFVINYINRLLEVRKPHRAMGIIVVLVLIPGTINIFNGNSIFSDLVNNLDKKESSVVLYLRDNSRANDRLALWGWESCIYPATGLIMATRESQTQRQMLSTSQQGYYLKRYLDDISEVKPRFFLDTTKRNDWVLNYAKHNFTNYPELKLFVEENYYLVMNLDGMYLYELCESNYKTL